MITFNFWEILKRKIAIKRGFVSVSDRAFNNESAKFKTRNILEYKKIVERDGEQKFLNKFLSVLQKDHILFDIGANMGLFSILAATKLNDHKIYSFEPIKIYYDVLLDNIKLNKAENIHTFNFGLGSQEGPRSFAYKNKIGSGMGSGIKNYDSAYKINTDEQICEIKIGDLLIHNSSLPVPNIIKIDVEGMELNVLKGFDDTLKKNECKYVFCEVHTRLKPELYSKVCYLLQDFGFETENVYAKKEGVGILGFK